MAKHHQRKKEGESTSNGASHGRLHKGGDILGSLVVYLNISISGGKIEPHKNAETFKEGWKVEAGHPLQK